MSSLVLKNLALDQGAEKVIYDLSATMHSGINLLIGPTLAGKTTLMRIIAGLVKPTAGSFELDGKDLTNLPMKKRSVSFVYQQFINYPSLSVFDNIASPLKVSAEKQSKEQIADRVEKMAKLLGLTNFLLRKPSELSGGQQQRVAIARALARQAEIVLLDEPLANLDYKLREQLRAELQSIFSAEKAIVIYSTAEPSEALDFATQTFVMNEGKLIQEGKALDVYQSPANLEAATAISDPPLNIIRSKIEGNRASVDGLTFNIPQSNSAKINNAEIFLGIQPGKITLSPESSNSVSLDTHVELSEVTGSSTFIHVKLKSGELIVVEVNGAKNFELDQKMKVYFEPSDLYGFDAQSEESIFFPSAAVN
ncbi:MAG: ABC transporter ATP-binding protein [Candidatus Nanopelagicaceae bacterium]